MRRIYMCKWSKAGVLAISAVLLLAGCGGTSGESSATIKVETLPPETEQQETERESVSELALMMQVNERIDYAYLEKALTYLTNRYDDVSYIENTSVNDDPEYTLLKQYLERALVMRAAQDAAPVYDGEPVSMGVQLIGDDQLVALETEETMPEDQMVPYAYYRAECLDDFMTLIGSTKTVAEMGMSWREDIPDQIAVPSSGFGGFFEDYSVEMHAPQVRTDGIYAYYRFISNGFMGEETEERVVKIIPDNANSLGYKIEWIKLADEVPAAEDVSEQAEPESVYESRGAIEVVSVSELVETAREESVEYTDRSGNQHHAVFRIPRILIDSEDASQINDELLDELGATIDRALQAKDNGTSLTTDEIDYSAWVWNNTLTVFTTVKSGWGIENHYIYTLDMNDGHRMDNAQVAALWEKSEDELYAVLTDLIGEQFVNKYDGMAEDYPEYYEEQFANSVSEENVRDSVIYPDSKGSALANVRVYAMAGADSYEQIIGLGWE